MLHVRLKPRADRVGFSSQRGCKVWILAEKGFASSGRCKIQEASLVQLAAERCLMCTAKGLPRAKFGGLRHSKFVMCDFGGAIQAMQETRALPALGSCSLTDANRGNLEAGLCVELTEHGTREVASLFDARFEKASQLMQASSGS